MAKNNARWQRIHAYELMKKKMLGQASADELEAVNKYLALLCGGVKKVQIFNVSGKLVVR